MNKTLLISLTGALVALSSLTYAANNQTATVKFYSVDANNHATLVGPVQSQADFTEGSTGVYTATIHPSAKFKGYLSTDFGDGFVRIAKDGQFKITRYKTDYCFALTSGDAKPVGYAPQGYADLSFNANQGQVLNIYGKHC
jgi:hypothetical protein